ncbi:MAG: hypothetical protein WCJ33_00625 [Pseudomonadota bacterium]
MPLDDKEKATLGGVAFKNKYHNTNYFYANQLKKQEKNRVISKILQGLSKINLLAKAVRTSKQENDAEGGI